MSLLLARQEASFSWLMEQTGATKGNLSIQLKNLEEAGYLRTDKQGAGAQSRTTCFLTSEGIDAFERYVEALKAYFPSSGNTPAS